MSEETETVPNARRRGLGPFSGAQLTVIIVVFAVLLLAPVSAWAVAGSNVFVTDSGTGQRAFVSGAGQLNVTRAGAKSFFARGVSVINGGQKVVVAPTSGHAMVVTSIAVDTFKATAPGAGKYITFAISRTNATCATVTTPGGFSMLRINPGAVGMTVIPLDPGIVIPAGRALCADNNDDTDIGAEIYAQGYSIPAAAAPTGSAIDHASSNAAPDTQQG